MHLYVNRMYIFALNVPGFVLIHIFNDSLRYIYMQTMYTNTYMNKIYIYWHIWMNNVNNAIVYKIRAPKLELNNFIQGNI